MEPSTCRRFLEDFDVVLLDQGRTFMFDNDRFGPYADYFRTYRQLGGTALGPEAVRTIVDALCQHLLVVGRDPARYEFFPSVPSALRQLSAAADLAEEEIERVADLVALHEVGEISAQHVAAIRALAKNHRLGIVSNVWGGKQPFEENLAASGVRGCFECRVWSSEYDWIKPSARLFGVALGYFGLQASRVLFVGDHPMRDVDAAKQLGCGTVWIRNGESVFPEGLREPDRVVTHLEDLLQLS